MGKTELFQYSPQGVDTSSSPTEAHATNSRSHTLGRVEGHGLMWLLAKGAACILCPVAARKKWAGKQPKQPRPVLVTMP